MSPTTSKVIGSRAAEHREAESTDATFRATELDVRLVLDSVPGLVATNTPGGETEFVNRQLLDYFGRTLSEIKGWRTLDAVHPDDLPRVVTMIGNWMRSPDAGPFEIDLRLRRSDSVHRWFHLRAQPARDTAGHVLRWYHLLTDIEDRKRVEDVLRASELDLRVIIDTIPGFVWTMNATGEVELVNRQMVDYFGAGVEELKDWSSFLCEDDRARVVAEWKHTIQTIEPYKIEHRLRRADGEYRWFQSRGLPLRNAEGRIVRWYNLLTDIDARKQAEEKLRGREDHLRRVVDGIPGFIFSSTADGGIEFVNQQLMEYTGRTLEELKQWATTDLIHPDDLPRVLEELHRSIETGQSQNVEHRVRGADGQYRWFDVRRLPERDRDGRIVRWYLVLFDIHDRKQAEEQLRRSEADLLEAQQLTHTGHWKLDVVSGTVTVSPEVLRRYGVTPDDDTSHPEFWLSRIHPEDRPRVQEQLERCLSDTCEYQADYRIALPDGTVKYEHSFGRPIVSSCGELVEFGGTTIDVTEQVQARIELENAFEEIRRLKDRLQDENLALKEEIAQASMFEEIVGTSRALRQVLALAVKVAPTNSSVLITGETGTGKELIARAIHKRSPRADRAFVSVNCAALPSSLISSELFGHEKGAFTGAIQRRIGRFELAHGGTLFLDEVGELPADIQISLLRVLQEKEFERVGGSQTIRVDVRIIAATNRDLDAAVASGSLRSDLCTGWTCFPLTCHRSANAKTMCCRCCGTSFDASRQMPARHLTASTNGL